MKQYTIDKCITHFKTIYPNVPIPKVIWNLNMRTTAGKVRFDSILRQVKCIELNPNLLIDVLKIESTFLHELAHVADWNVYKKIGHGPTWSHIMRQLGQKPDRCHQYETSHLKRKHKKVAKMQCSCRIVEITSMRYKKILRGYSYNCGKCKSNLKLIA